MARDAVWGTPSRSSGYQRPRGTGFLFAAGLAAGGVLSGALLAAQAIGARGALSPGPVSSAHAPMSDRCEECHAPRRGVLVSRCERCHDAAGAKNLTLAAHAGAATAATGAAPPAGLSCERCHVEHEGRAARLASVSSFECAQCHFRSFAAHPEFAVLRERGRERPGLRFDHALHLELLVEAGGGGGSAACTRCHEPSVDARDFQPLSFERHCAGCHAGEGWRHGDPAVVADWLALWRRLDPAGWAAERGALQARLAGLRERLAHVGQAAPGGQPPPPALTLAARKRLETALETAEARLRLLSTGGALAPSEPEPAEREALRKALEARVAACSGCHPPEATGGFAPVRAAQRILKGTTFVHAPHLMYSDCARCHATIARSRSAEELHVEEIATCRNCHDGGGVRDDCQGCHRYHPRPSW